MLILISNVSAFGQFVVNDTGDQPDFVIDGVCETAPANGICTLRAAIAEANAAGVPVTISFDNAVFPDVIRTNSELVITGDNITINGDVDAVPDFIPDVTLGRTAGLNSGIRIQGANNTIKYLHIIEFVSAGQGAITIDGVAAIGNKVLGCYIGTDPTASAASVTQGNFRGIAMINSASGNFVGSGNPNEGNVIGNNTFGVYINNSDGNTIQGNIIGLDITASIPIANIGSGVETISADGTIIGGVNAGEGNIMSGNNDEGILLSNCTNSNILGNIIGLDIAGNTIIANGNEGIRIQSGSSLNFIGDGTPGGRNIISGNTQEGIEVNNSNNNTIIGNYIGLTSNGVFGRGNSGSGIWISGTSTSNTIGTGGQGNVISGNGGNGILLSGDANFVFANFIGLNSGGGGGIGNSLGGIVVTGDNNEIGDAVAGFGNAIDANGWGIGVTQGTGTKIEGNYIGLNAGGLIGSPNLNEGIRLTTNATNVSIGNGTSAGANYISNNTLDGILINGAGVTGITISLNYIGTRTDGNASPNGGNGILFDNNTSSNLVQNTVIANNANNGIEVTGGASSNVFTENSIYNNGGGVGKGILIGSGLPNPPSVDNITTAGVISGTANIGATVEIFLDAVDQGEFYLATVAADGAGAWTYSAAITSFPGGLLNATATQLSGGYTSEFSASRAIPFLPFEVVNTNDTGAGSLRWAMENANVTPGLQTVTFNIPNTDLGYEFPTAAGGERWNILPATDLPQISEDIIIDATTQPGIGSFRILVDGQGTLTNGFDVKSPSTFFGLYITDFFRGINDNFGGNITVGDVNKGNVINSCNTGVATATSSNHVFKGNFIGTDETGSFAVPNTNGISMTSASNVTIGGSLPGEENVISGNTSTGVGHNVGNNNLFEGNLIGTNATGTAAIPNGTGLSFGTGGGHSIIDNVISGNTVIAIAMNNAGNITFQGNKIGVGLNGTDPIPNGVGIETITFLGGANNTIGGLGLGEANIIAHNINQGVYFRWANNINNLIIGNSIFANGGKGIDLEGTGNGNKQAPVISSVITGTVTGTGTDGDVIHLYRDNSGFTPLQGQEYLGTGVVAGGTWTISEGTIVSTDLINATATDASNNTSEFAFNFGEIDVYQGFDNSGTPLTDGQVADVDIGSAFEGYDLDQVFAIENTSGAPLLITSITVTGTDYEILQAPILVDPGATENFALRLSGAAVGTFTTTVTIVSEDEDENPFTFPVTGQIIVNPAPDPLLVTNVDNGLITGSFRTVVAYANTNAGADVITFDPVLAGQEILLVDDIFLTEAVTIDGDFDGSGDCVPDITINGVGGGDGIWVDGGNSVIKHLNLTNYPGSAIWIRSDNNQIYGNYIGINLAGDDASTTGNLYGIWVLDGDGNVVGGSTPCEQNVISGNFWGVVVGGNATTNFNTQVIGNIIGLDETGTFIPGQGNTDGIVLDETGLGGIHMIGGTNPGEGNIISGNGRGILAADLNGEIQILGNYIGTDITGTVGIGNTSYGIYSLANTRVGNGTVAGRNIISGHAFPAYGIYFAQSSSYTGDSYALGNYFGTDVSGTLPLPNYVGLGAGNNEVAQSVFIGDGTPGGRNLFAYNDYGIDIVRGNTYVSGNYIGTDPAGTVAQGNMVGVSVWSQTEPSLIGDGTAAGANVISGNTTGIDIGFGITNNVTIDFNYIGVRDDGTTPLPNTGDGIYMYNNVTDVTITNNVISNSGSNGINLDGVGVLNNLITTNSIFNNTAKGINVVNGAQNTVPAPLISGVFPDRTISGTSDINADVEIFADAGDEGEFLIGTTTADGAGNWNLVFDPVTIPGGLTNATATQTSSVNTSEFSSSSLIPTAFLPAAQADGLIFSAFTPTQVNVNWTPGDGLNRIVLIKEATAIDSDPINDATYIANSIFGSGDQLGIGNYVIYNGSGNAVTVTGLSSGSTYHVRIYEYNGTPGDEKYLLTTSGANPASFTLGPEITAFQGVDNSGTEIFDGQVTSIDFGSALIGSDIDVTFAIENIGNTDLNIIGITSDGLKFSEFGSITTPIVPGATQTFVIRLDGSVDGLFSENITISNDDSDEGLFTFPVTGTITLTPEPEISVFFDPGGTNAPITDGQVTDVDFGADVLGNDITQNFAIENIGSAVLNISGITVTGTDFSVLSVPATVAVGATETFAVQLSGASIGTFNDVLTIQNDDTDEAAFDFPVAGTISPPPEPEIAVYVGNDNTGTPVTDGQVAPIDFGSGPEGIDIDINFAIENTGPASLNFGAITITGTAFGLVGAPPVNVAPGGTEIITVRLSGAAAGSFSETITINNDDADEGVFDFILSGTINASSPEINLYAGPDNTGTIINDGQATAINFGSAFLGTDILQVFAIENTGSSDLNINSVSVGPGPFSITTTAPPVITPGSTGTFTVQLSGAAIGTFNTIVTILNDDLDEATFDFNVSGTINLPPEAEIGVFAGPDNTGLSILDGQVTSFSVGSAPVGTDIDQVFTIENTGSTDLNILGITSSSTAFSLQSPLPPPIPVGTSDNFTIRLSGAAEGVFNATLTIENNDTDEAFFDFPISGTITGPEIEVFVGTDNSGIPISAGQVTPIDFGAETAGTDIDQVFAIENQGVSDLIISGISVTGPDFSILNGASQTISAGLTGNFTVRLNGQIAGSYTDNIVIASNDSDEATFGFPVAGTINAIEIVIKNGQDASAPIVVNGQPDSVDIGQTPQFININKMFVIENTGSTDLNILSISTDNPAIFTIINPPSVITPGTFATFTVQLNALIPGVYGANVTVSSDAGDYIFPVSGEVLELPPDPPIIVYNAVTPNGDGKHDYLRIENIEAYPGNNVFIYTRLGKKIFEIENYMNADSQRRFEGYSNVGNVETSPDGTYYYVITRQNVRKNISGFFILSQ